MVTKIVIFSFLVVKVYVVTVDGTSLRWLQRAMRTESQVRWQKLATWDNLHFLGSCQGLRRQGRRNFTVVAATCHTDEISTTVAETCHTVGSTSTMAVTCQTVRNTSTVATTCHTGWISRILTDICYLAPTPLSSNKYRLVKKIW